MLSVNFVGPDPPATKPASSQSQLKRPETGRVRRSPMGHRFSDGLHQVRCHRSLGSDVDGE